ncbi:hypothetical protein [Cohnella yongneupensis]|uniref:DUF5050 domain-containing protein n=1 Tax=Cohnella yongneupensis TaxID=425006 RepID=A0ABW0QZ59_9BACL
MLTGAVRKAPSPGNVPELKITAKKIAVMNPKEPLTIYWAKSEIGLYQTVITSKTTKTSAVISGNYGNVLYQNYESVYLLKYDKNRKSDIYQLEISTKKIKRLTNEGNIDYFFLKKNSIYYVKGSMGMEPSVYRISLNGKSKVRVSPTVLDVGDKKYRYYIGSTGPIEEGEDIYFPLVRNPWPSSGEKYIEPLEEEYSLESENKDEEVLSAFEVEYSDYIGDIDSDSFVFTEKDAETEMSYLHLIFKNKEKVRKINGWSVEPLDILNGWVYFTAEDTEGQNSGLFAIKLDGSGLRQIGNDEFSYSDYIGNVKGYLVFQDRNKGSFTVFK